MVEAIGVGTTVIATETGAAGINKNICGNKLIIVQDKDWKKFAEAIIENSTNTSITPQEYYNNYYWKNIVQNALTFIN